MCVGTIAEYRFARKRNKARAHSVSRRAGSMSRTGAIYFPGRCASRKFLFRGPVIIIVPAIATFVPTHTRGRRGPGTCTRKSPKYRERARTHFPSVVAPFDECRTL